MKLHGSNELEFFCNTGFVNAFLYYTTDTSDWGCKNYQWKKTEASVMVNNLSGTADIPSDALYYFVNAVTRDSLIISSEMQKTGFIK